MTNVYDAIGRLENWCASLSEEEAHDFTLSLELLDNPGWHVSAGRVGQLGRSVRPFSYDRGEHDWLDVSLSGDKIVVVAGPSNLGEALTLIVEALVGTSGSS